MPGRAWATPPSRRASTQRSGSRRRRTCTTTSTPCSPRTSRCGTRSASCTPAARLQVKVAWPGALCPGWLAAARAAARRISSAPACLGLPSAPDRSPPLPRLDAEDALRRDSTAAVFCCPAHGRDSSLSRLRSSRDPSAVHRAGLVRCSATEPRLLPAEEARSGLPLNFADHALYLGTYLGPRGGS